MSKEYKNYLKKLKFNKFKVIFCQILIAVLFIVIWQVLADKNLINTFITSSPKNIISTLISLYNQNNLFLHIWVSVKETIIAFLITSIVSILIAIILYNFNFLSKVLDPYLIILNSLPKVALGPIIIIWIGANTKSVLISIIVSIHTIYNGFKNTDKLKIKLLNTFNASKKDILLNVVIPSNKDVILNTFKINISMCLIGLSPVVGKKIFFNKCYSRY